LKIGTTKQAANPDLHAAFLQTFYLIITQFWLRACNCVEYNDTEIYLLSIKRADNSHMRSFKFEKIF